MYNYSGNALTSVQQKTAAAALGQSFSQDPFMTYLLPNAATRVQQLTKLFLPLIRCSLRYGGLKLLQKGAVRSCGFLVNISPSDYLKLLKVLYAGSRFYLACLRIDVFRCMRKPLNMHFRKKPQLALPIYGSLVFIHTMLDVASVSR